MEQRKIPAVESYRSASFRFLKAFNYIRYFTYIALNWNLRLASFTVYHEIRGEGKYKINTTGINDLKKLELKGKFRDQAEVYQGASYHVMEKLFSRLVSLGVSGPFVDFGSGKGRVMVVAAYFGFLKITGVEFARELVVLASENIRKAQTLFPETRFVLLHENAVNYEIGSDAEIFFFFNPFKKQVMRKVCGNILSSVRKYPRTVYVVYVNPQLKEVFVDAGFEEVFYYRKMQYVDGSVLKLGV